MTAIRLRHTEMVWLLIYRAPQNALLHAAAASQSYQQAVVSLSRFWYFDNRQSSCEPRIINLNAYSADVPDWKVTIWLVIIGIVICIDPDACIEHSNIDDAERARYLSVLPAAINLARELGFGWACDDEMTKFASGIRQCGFF